MQFTLGVRVQWHYANRIFSIQNTIVFVTRPVLVHVCITGLCVYMYVCTCHVCQYVAPKLTVWGSYCSKISLMYSITCTFSPSKSLLCGLLCCGEPFAHCFNSFGSLQDNERLNLLTNKFHKEVIMSLTDKVHK